MPDAGRGRKDPHPTPAQSCAWISDPWCRMWEDRFLLLSSPQPVVIVTATHAGLSEHRPLLTGVTSPVRSRPGGWGGRVHPAEPSLDPVPRETSVPPTHRRASAFPRCQRNSQLHPELPEPS